MKHEAAMTLSILLKRLFFPSKRNQSIKLKKNERFGKLSRMFSKKNQKGSGNSS